MDFSIFDQRPIVVAIAGPNGAGKTTFYHSHIAAAGLHFVNADRLAAELELEPYQAARLADAVRRELLNNRESFVFETVFSDPVGDKIAFLEEAASSGYTVVLCFIGLASSKQSTERVAMRVTQGGHDVPDEKLKSRFDRTLNNLKLAIRKLPQILIYDNSDLAKPFRQVAAFEQGKLVDLRKPVPGWLRPMVSKKKKRKNSRRGDRKQNE